MFKVGHPHNTQGHETFDSAVKAALDAAEAHPGHEVQVFDTGPGDYARSIDNIVLSVTITRPGIPFITSFKQNNCIGIQYNEHATLAEARQFAIETQNLFPGVDVEISYDGEPHTVLCAPQAERLTTKTK